MKAQFRNYVSEPRFGEDYHKVRAFLIEIGATHYHFGRFDWMITHGYLDESALPRIGIWEDNGGIVGLATFDCELGDAFLLARKGYEILGGEMLMYAEQNLAKDGKFKVNIPNSNHVLQGIAAGMGYIATGDKEEDAMLPINEKFLDYTLPEGFSIVDMEENYDYYKYRQVLWKGFNHEADGEGPLTISDEAFERDQIEFNRPNVNKRIKVAVVAPNGDFVSYCGMWQDSASKIALVEPVATDPAYRKMGLGKAAVLEAVKRCGELGATKALVGSSQQFYYSIGFRPYSTNSFWVKR